MRINDIMRAGVVTRWHIVGVHRQQSIAEHMWRVGMLTRHLCATVLPELPYGTEYTWAALTHDIDEVIFGDIPRPAKQLMRSAGFDPAVLTCEHELGGQPLGALGAAIVKYCDLLEAELFLIEEGCSRHPSPHRRAVYDYIQAAREDCLDNLVHLLRCARAARDAAPPSIPTSIYEDDPLHKLQEWTRQVLYGEPQMEAGALSLGAV